MGGLLSQSGAVGGLLEQWVGGFYLNLGGEYQKKRGVHCLKGGRNIRRMGEGCTAARPCACQESTLEIGYWPGSWIWIRLD